MLDKTAGERELNPFKERRFWWLEPGSLLLIIMLIIVGSAIEYYVYLLRYTNVLIIFGLFWGVGTVGVMLMYKRILYEPRVKVDEKKVEQTRHDLHMHRKGVQREFTSTEVAVLARGETTPVLDVWRLDPTMQKLHSYFSRLELLEVDPKVGEFRIRIQLGEIGQGKGTAHQRDLSLAANVLRLFQVMSKDGRFLSIKKFFHVIVAEFYILQEIEEGRDRAVPILSILMKESDLPTFTSVGQATFEKLQRLCDLRYEGGSEITPHRGLVPGAERAG